MKRRFSKILGIGLTLSLIASLLLVAAPVLANVSQPTVDIDETEISFDGAVYTLSFRINTELTGTTDSITVRFPDDTDMTNAFVADTGVSFTSGIGFASGATATVTDTSSFDDRTMEIVLTSFDNFLPGPPGIGAMAYVQVVIEGVKNPTEPSDDYTLEVQTNEEDTYVDSEAYEIEVPVVGGFVYVYNPANILLATYGGQEALNNADYDNRFDEDDYVIKIGPGTYTLTFWIYLEGDGIILESSDGAADTIIYCEDGGVSYGIHILGEGVTIDGFTFESGDPSVTIDELDAVVTNCEFTDADGIGGAGVEIDTNALNATVSDCVFDGVDSAIYFVSGGDLDDADITGNTITGCTGDGAIVFAGGNIDIDITGNTITANEAPGILFEFGGATSSAIDIDGNTITLNEADGIWIAGAAPTDLVIIYNTITDNEEAGLTIDTWTPANCVLILNDIHDNDESIDAAADMDIAILNWWGSAVEDDIEDEFNTTMAGVVTYEPWLMGAQGTIASGAGIAVADVDSLDAKDDAGVKVSGMADDVPLGADIISGFKYLANPQDAIDDAIAFYDLYVALPDTIALADVSAKLKLYDSAITENSVASFWTGDFWAECSDQEARDGIVYITLTEDTLPAVDELAETAFVVVAGEAVTGLDAPALLAPEVGASDVSLTPAFAWGAVTDAIGYDFEMADNTLFVLPLVSLTGELGRLIVTAYAYVGELPYSTAYYWRVKAVSADEESDWASSVFITMDEPVEPTPPVVIEPYEPPVIEFDPPDIIVQAPDVIVPLPAETPITPAWIYVIIAVGAILVISVIVLIVRTRRVA